MKRGDIVYDKADPRHLGRIVSILHRNTGTFATIRWLETGWLSYEWATGNLVIAQPAEPEITECAALRDALQRSVS